MAGTKARDAVRDEFPHLRMVLVGKTGVGKSASGNTILGKIAFESITSFSSSIVGCRKVTGQVDGHILDVVDTPGLFDTLLTQEQVKTEIVKCVTFVAPGPHVFLVVIQIGRFTKAEEETIKILQKIFGVDAACYTIVLFTYGDNLPNGIDIDKSISGNRSLHRFINQCGGRYHVFNNRSEDRAQVKELLEKINTMVQRNGATYYTNDMLQEAERAIREEMERLLRQNPDMGEEEARKQAQMKNKILRAAGIGAGFGSILGPVGAALGAALGAAVVAAKEKKCATQ